MATPQGACRRPGSSSQTGSRHQANPTSLTFGHTYFHPSGWPQRAMLSSQRQTEGGRSIWHLVPTAELPSPGLLERGGGEVLDAYQRREVLVLDEGLAQLAR